uniref:MFP1 attachment factor 1 n=1 Tax=Oryza sativa subsp. japonica TaxID=39947 RepID=Q7XIN7_ORYSJ|nr:putative MFP1 attachment factor 1 [Oryza sativa Japonica Group]
MAQLKPISKCAFTFRRSSRSEANQIEPHPPSLRPAQPLFSLSVSPLSTPQISPLSISHLPAAMAEDAPSAAAAEGSQHASAAEGGSAAAAASAAPAAKAAEALLPSLSIWPPSQRTRDAVVRRLVQTLVAPSILSQRYGAVPEAEAGRAAAAVEAEAYAAVTESSSAAAAPASVEDGIEVLQAYSKEVSRRLLELAKSRAAPSPAAAAPAEGAASESEAAAAPAPAEE